VQPDSHRKITDPALYGDRPKVDLKLKDPAIAALTRDDRLAICMNQNQALNGTPKLISVTSSISDSSGESAMAGSNGFSGMQDRTSLWFGTEVSLQAAGDKKPEGWMWAGARHRAGTPDPTAVAKMALIRAQGMLGAKKGPSKKTVMIVDPSAGPRLIGRLLRTANGRSVSQGKSFWSKKIGKKAVSDTLSITDDPSLVRGLGSRTYDSEGITAKPLKVIESGVLRNLYIDTYYGSKLSMAPTTGGRSNLVLGLGKRDLKSILADCPDAFYVTGWLGGNADAATGDYSFGFRGFLIKDGKRAAPVSEMNITGNLLGLFSKLTELGNDPWPYSSVRAPTLVFDGVDFSGA